MDVKKKFDPNWKTKYASLFMTQYEAVKKIHSGQRVFIGSGCSEPQGLVRALTARAGELADIEIVQLLSIGDAPYADKKYAGTFTVNAFYIGNTVREMIREGFGSYTPIFLSDIPRLFASGRLPLHTALIQVGPPDEDGMCSFGVAVDIVKSAAENATTVIAQVNPNMPRTLGDSFINIFDIDVLVPCEEPLIEMPDVKATEVSQKIGEFVSSLVEDGSTIELGIGKIPHSVAMSLKGKRDLGIHTEMVTDSMMELIKSGAVTGAYKTLDKGKVVASFCFGTQELYDFVDNNPVFSFHPTEYVNDTTLISRQNKMVAINTALQVDLTGQVCADSLGSEFYSGIGGQVDFNRGAARAPRGKAIIALPATAKGDTISRITCTLTPGAGVVTTRGDVHYVVTEFGVAYLHGKSVQERTLALISVAHPKFRAELIEQAIKEKYLRPELKDVEGKFQIGPKELRATMLLNDGTQINFRAIHPTDEPRMRDLFYNLSKQTVYYRYMSQLKSIPRSQVQNFVYIDHWNAVSIVGTLPTAAGEEIISVGAYYLDKKTNRAEVAFTVADAWQKKGVGSFLMSHLATIARRNGLTGFTAEVLAENKPMQKVFFNSGLKVTTKLNEGIISFEMDL
ncbi:MAG: GNAT family N-acetyltransferase [Nitrospinae bacterium]|nr:GNAT family N-acetyltransferase [Nitrospinota bacterium]